MTWYTLVKVYSGTFNAHRRTQIGNLARSNPEQRMSRDTCVFCTLVKFWGNLQNTPNNDQPTVNPFSFQKLQLDSLMQSY